MPYYSEEQRRRAQLIRQRNARVAKLRESPEDYHDIFGHKVPRVSKIPNPIDYGIDSGTKERIKRQDDEYIAMTKSYRLAIAITVTIVFIVIYIGALSLQKFQNDSSSIGWFVGAMSIGGFYGAFVLWAWPFNVIPPKTRQHKLIEDYEKQLDYYKYWERKKNKDHWNNMSGHEFENAVANQFRAIGFDAKVSKRGGDGGIDIILTLGTRKIAVQCKRYSKPVGPHVIRDLLGTMQYLGYSEGSIVTTTGFTSGVRHVASSHSNIYLIDLNDLLKSIDNPNYLTRKVSA